jgi:hypothetical protein
MDRYFSDIRSGIAMIIDGKKSCRQHCTLSYPDESIKLIIHGKYFADRGYWVIHKYSLLFLKLYLKFLNLTSKSI